MARLRILDGGRFAREGAGVEGTCEKQNSAKEEKVDETIFTHGRFR